MKPISRRSAIKSGLVVAAATSSPAVQSAFHIPDAMAQQTFPPKLFVQGSPDFFGINVNVYHPDVQLPGEEQLKEVTQNDSQLLIGGLLDVSRNRGDGSPINWHGNDDLIWQKSERILAQKMYNDQTVAGLLSESQLFWWEENPVILVGVAPYAKFAIASLTGAFFATLGANLADDMYAMGKAFFLELFE